MLQLIAAIGLEAHGSRVVFFGDPSVPTGNRPRRKVQTAGALPPHAAVDRQSRDTAVTTRTVCVELTPGHQLL